MKQTYSFVMLPRSLFRSEGWKKATKEQRLALVDLYSRVAYSEYEYMTKSGNMVRLKKGQMATTQRDLATTLEMDRSSVRRILDYWQKCGMISTLNSTLGTTHKKYQYTILTIIALADSHTCSCDPCFDPMNDPHKEENINNKKINTPLKKSPQGDFSLDDFSSESQKVEGLGFRVEGKEKVEGAGQTDGRERLSEPTNVSPRRTITSELNEKLEECRQRWRERLTQEGYTDARRFSNYLPYNLTTLCSKPENVEIINCNGNIVRVGDKRIEAFIVDFFEFHLLEFVCGSGLNNKTRHAVLKEQAARLCAMSRSLNVGQVALFFYYLRTSDTSIGPPRWKNLYSESVLMEAFNRFVRRCPT